MRVASWNVNGLRAAWGKGFPAWVNDGGADLVALQEVDRGADRTGRRDLLNEIAFHTGLTPLFGKNIPLQGGEYGNAILSRYPIVHAQNRDVSSHAFEQRGLLHCAIAVPGYTRPVHCVCVHLALHERGDGATPFFFQHGLCGAAAQPAEVTPELNSLLLQAFRYLHEHLRLVQ